MMKCSQFYAMAKRYSCVAYSFISKKKNQKSMYMDMKDYPTTFPYKVIAADAALIDYNKLRNRTFINNMSRIGNTATDRFTFKPRMNTEIRGTTHFKCFTEQKEKLFKCMVSLKYKKITPAAVLASIRMRIGSVNQFRPAYAKFIYKKYNSKKVLDISAGWGGRMLGAMACDIDYTGFDTNLTLAEPYKKIIAAYPHSGTCKLITQDSSTVDYSKYDYDTVFTSPPYFMLEKYEHMPAYTSKADFNKKYWQPVVMNSWANLKAGGYYILNCPAVMGGTAAEYIGRAADEVIPYYISSRVKDGKRRFENVYVWHKE